MALGLMSFCLVAMLGMLPVGLRQERDSTDKMAAMQVLAAVGSDFQNTTTDSGETVQYSIPTGAGTTGSFFVDQACERTERQADAEYNVWYKVDDAVGSQAAPRMHVYVARVRPGALAQQSVVAEGIAQKRL